MADLMGDFVTRLSTPLRKLLTVGSRMPLLRIGTSRVTRRVLGWYHWPLVTNHLPPPLATSSSRIASHEHMRSFYPFLVAAVMLTPPVSAHAQQKPQAQLPQQPATAQQPEQPIEEMPTTVRPDGGDKRKTIDTDPVMGVPALPNGKTSMIGGTVSKIDGVHNKMNVKIFGKGGQWDLAFDERTHFYRDGAETTFENVKKGDRVYVDTMLDGHRILARNVRVVTNTGPADARGQVTSYGNGSMEIRDELSARPVFFQVTDATEVKRDGRAGSLADVRQGSLIAVQFLPGKENRGVAKTITVLAAPGENFTFAGKITHLDLRAGILAVENRTDSKTYDIAFDREHKLPSNLMVGSDVKVAAMFDGKQYKASQINVEPSAR